MIVLALHLIDIVFILLLYLKTIRKMFQDCENVRFTVLSEVVLGISAWDNQIWLRF